MKHVRITATQLELLKSLADGREHQVRVQVSTTRGRSSGVWTRTATILALRDAGLVTSRSEKFRETDRGITKYGAEIYATATPAGLAYLREMKFVTEQCLGLRDHRFTTAAHAYHAHLTVSARGDRQWTVDRDDKPGWAQFGTLADVRRNIAADARTP